MKEDTTNPTAVFQSVLKSACEGTRVTTRELLKTLAWEDIARIKEGEITVEDLRLTVLELEDSKDKASLYTICTNSGSPLINESL